MCAGDFAYLPKMQFLNLGGVLIVLWLTLRNNWGLGGIWWCLVFYFGFRVFFHSCYIAVHWKTHVSVKVQSLRLPNKYASQLHNRTAHFWIWGLVYKLLTTQNFPITDTDTNWRITCVGAWRWVAIINS